MIDIVIIGGGPSGITAGTILQKEGYKTCIIDCNVFPREKLCAGVLTVKAINLLRDVYNDMDLKKLDIKYINKIELLYKCKTIGKYTVNNGYSVTNRKEFDNELLQYYKNVGGIIFEGQNNYKIIYDKSKIILSEGKEIQYDYLIGADGINSKVRSFVQNRWKASILCFEGFIPNDLNEDTIEIDFGGMIGGYSWRIPGKERIGVGLGEFYIRGMRRTPRRYKCYFNNQGVKALEDVKGAFVSFGHYVRKPIRDNVLLVGDAAGLVDAMTGEGIYFAIESGRQAALAIVDHLEKERPLEDYLKRIGEIHKKMKEQSLYNKLLYVPIIQLLSLRYVKKNPEFVHRILDNTISTYHTSYTQEVLRSKSKR